MAMNMMYIFDIILVICYVNTGVAEAIKTVTPSPRHLLRRIVKSPSSIKVREPTSPFEYIVGNYSDFESQVMYLQAQYCDKTCDRKFPVKINNPNNECAPCFCDDLCYYYHDCCPDKVLFNPASNNTTTIKFGCTKVKFPYYNIFSRVIDSCPDKFSNILLKNNCVNNSLHWMYIKPVSDPVTKLSYRNKYCALCYNISHLNSWKTRIKCGSSSDYGKSNSLTDIYFNVIHNENCTLSFIPSSDDIESRACSLVQQPYYSKCNQTGQWRHYDKKVEMACGLYTNIVNGKYKNVFCKVCNEDILWKDLMYKYVRSFEFRTFSLTTLLNLRDDDIDEVFRNHKEDKPVYETCDINEILNPATCECMKKFCSERELLVDGECRSIFLQSNSYGYEVCIRVSGTFNSSDLQSAFKVFSKSFPSWNVLPSIITNSYYRPLSVSQCNDGLVNIVAVVFTQIMFKTPINTDEKQNELLRNIYALNQYLSKDGSRIQVDLLNNCKQMDFSSQKKVQHRSSCVSAIANNVIYRFIFGSDMLFSGTFVKFTKLLTCTHIHMNSSEVLVNNNDISLTLLHNNITLTSGEYEERDGLFAVCSDDYLYRTSTDKCKSRFELIHNINNTSNVSSETGVNPLGITSIVCTCISLIFLLITFIFYSTVKYMRNVVGVNVMGLIVNMFMAQLVYQFGLELIDYPHLCKAIGIFIHYFWLSATFWMNSCTFVLFFKLSFPLKSLGFSSKYILKRCLVYSTLSPLLIVMITMVTNYVEYGNLGYGNRYMCYINKVVVRRFAFALPLGILILTNIVLFSYTFIKIKVNQMDSAINRENKVNILACLKLSVITGGSWIFGFIYEATDAIVFAYMFTILIGTQGIVLFFAFVVNKRVCLSFAKTIQTTSDFSHSTSTTKQN